MVWSLQKKSLMRNMGRWPVSKVIMWVRVETDFINVPYILESDHTEDAAYSFIDVEKKYPITGRGLHNPHGAAVLYPNGNSGYSVRGNPVSKEEFYEE